MVQSKLYLDSRFNSYSFLVLDLDACCGCHGYFPLSVHYYIALDYVKLRCRQSFVSKNLYCFGVCLSRVRNGDRALARLVRSPVRRPPVAGSSAARPEFPTENSRFSIKFCCLSRVES